MLFELQAYGDRGLRVAFGKEIAWDVQQAVHRFAKMLAEEAIPGVIEWVPSYIAVTIYYQAEIIRYHDLKKRIEALLALRIAADLANNNGKLDVQVYEIPTLYGGEAGVDLGFVAAYHQLAPEQVIALHSNAVYLVAMLGFMPGFPYLLGLPPRLATPRLASPRLRVARGAVGIAGQQTGIYPFVSPGGWQIIGQTPLALYEPQRQEPFLVKAGDYLCFRAIDQEEWRAIQQQIATGYYQVKTVRKVIKHP